MGDEYQPRLTSVKGVKRAMAVNETGRFQPGGDEDARILAVIAAAEWEIFEICADQFEEAPGDALARTFQSPEDGKLLTDRFAAFPEKVERVSGRMAVAGAEIAAGEWEVFTPPSPIRAGRHLTSGYFISRRFYRVTARWGWLTVPPPVKEAATLVARKLYHRETAPLGITGGDTPVYVPRQDHEVMRLLGPYIPAVLAA